MATEARRRRVLGRAPSLAAALIAAAWGGTLACARADVVQPGVTRVDSAGVRIITSAAPDTALAWRLDSIGLLSDAAGEPWTFADATPSTVLTDRAGRTYVLDPTGAIHRFGRDGRHERSLGRVGDGPGEMRRPLHLLQQGDSVAVFDVGRGALVRWGPELEAIADLPLRGALAGTRAIAFRNGGLWREVEADGALALQGDTSAAPVTLARVPLPASAAADAASTLVWDAAGPRVLVAAGLAYTLSLYEGNRLLASLRREAESSEAAPAAMPVTGMILLSDATMWVRRTQPEERPVRLDVFGSDGVYAGSLEGYHLPVGRLPNGELLVPRDAAAGGRVILRMRLVR